MSSSSSSSSSSSAESTSSSSGWGFQLLRRIVLLKPGEAPILAWATGYFFLLLMSYYLLRPMREALGIAKGADKLPWLLTGTLCAMLVANPLYAALASRVPRRRIRSMAAL